MFKDSVCPVCGQSAVTQCQHCGLRALGFDAAVHQGAGLLALAWIAMEAGAVPDPWTLASIQHCARVRQWLVHRVGELAQWARDHRPAQHGAPPRLSEFDKAIEKFAHEDEVLTRPMKELTLEKLMGGVTRFRELATEAVAAGLKLEPLPQAPERVKPAPAGADEARSG